MASQPDNPHDRFFKEAFSLPEVVIDFLNVFAPEPVRERINYATLTREVDTFTDEALAEHFADLVFSVQYGGRPVRLVLLLEHKSYTEEHIHFQLNRYMLNVWESQLTQKLPLTPILPVIVYHGHRRWKQRSVPDYFAPFDETLRSYLPAFDYLLVDLSTLTDERLPTLQSDYARLTAILLQNSRRKRELARMLDAFADVVRRLVDTPGGKRFVGTGFLYLSYMKDLTKVELFGIFTRITVQTNSTVMSVAEELIQEGIQKGRQEERQRFQSVAEELVQKGIQKGILEGRQEGRREAARQFIVAMLKLNLDAQTIASAAEMPLADVHAVIDEINRMDMA